jgi:hypothetical protein
LPYFFSTVQEGRERKKMNIQGRWIKGWGILSLLVGVHAEAGGIQSERAWSKVGKLLGVRSVPEVMYGKDSNGEKCEVQWSRYGRGYFLRVLSGGDAADMIFPRNTTLTEERRGHRLEYHYFSMDPERDSRDVLYELSILEKASGWELSVAEKGEDWNLAMCELSKTGGNLR